MDNKWIFAIIGAISGGIVGYIAGVKLSEARTDAKIEAEVEKYKQDVKRRNGASERVRTGIREDIGYKEQMDMPKTISSTSLDAGKVAIEKTDYHKIGEQYMKPSPEKLFGNEDPAENEHPEDDSPDYEVISGDEIDNIEPELITYLLWDPESNILKDEFGDEIEDRELLVGSILDDILASNGSGSLSEHIEPTIFIANHKINAYYEVDVVSGDGAEPVND